jgi:hypothetical protein
MRRNRLRIQKTTGYERERWCRKSYEWIAPIHQYSKYRPRRFSAQVPRELAALRWPVGEVVELAARRGGWSDRLQPLAAKLFSQLL